MAFRATAVACSKASRLPLTSKQANKDFYKGPGKLPGFGQRAQGRVPIGSKAPYRKEISKMRYFVAPEGWLDEQGSLKAMFTSPIKPYVYKRRPTRETPKVPTDWPKAATGKTDEQYEKNDSIYSAKGFNGEYYLQLAELNRGRTPA
ncbi:hypothetical protein P389DRAFT_167472 [Cystobasidium minutum MCA 4210]|uniref:uncharacterized protein n=1 Tax=Cystobasidium minutum MCA 4210 TaxID=1397322 RepID=UPI0034CFA3DC|eukprot:jgi/Rhomi1/167472/fgenesh1_kg.2_\